MVVKVYISGISGNKEVKKRQQRVLLILDSKNIEYEVIDIAEPGNEEQKDFMQNNSTSSGATISDPTPRHPLPPQIFNEDVYCGDYDQFDLSNEVDEMEIFLKLQPSEITPTVTSNAEIKLGNGDLLKSNLDEEINTDDLIKNEKHDDDDDDNVNDNDNDNSVQEHQQSQNLIDNESDSKNDDETPHQTINTNVENGNNDDNDDDNDDPDDGVDVDENDE